MGGGSSVPITEGKRRRLGGSKDVIDLTERDSDATDDSSDDEDRSFVEMSGDEEIDPSERGSRDSLRRKTLSRTVVRRSLYKLVHSGGGSEIARLASARILKALDNQKESGILLLSGALTASDLAYIHRTVDPLGILIHYNPSAPSLEFAMPGADLPWEQSAPGSIGALMRQMERSQSARLFRPEDAPLSRVIARARSVQEEKKSSSSSSSSSSLSPVSDDGVTVYPVARTDTVQIGEEEDVVNLRARTKTSDLDRGGEARVQRMNVMPDKWHRRLLTLDHLADDGKDEAAADAADDLVPVLLGEHDQPHYMPVMAWLRYYMQRGQEMSYPNVPPFVDLRSMHHASPAYGYIALRMLRLHPDFDPFQIEERAEYESDAWMHPWWAVAKDKEGGSFEAWTQLQTYDRKLFIHMYARGDPTKFQSIIVDGFGADREDLEMRLRLFLGLVPDRARRVFMTNIPGALRGLLPDEIIDTLLPVQVYNRVRKYLPQPRIVIRQPSDLSYQETILFDWVLDHLDKAAKRHEGDVVDHAVYTLNPHLRLTARSRIEDILVYFATASPRRVFAAIYRHFMTYALYVVSPNRRITMEQIARARCADNAQWYGPPVVSTFPWDRPTGAPDIDVMNNEEIVDARPEEERDAFDELQGM